MVDSENKEGWFLKLKKGYSLNKCSVKLSQDTFPSKRAYNVEKLMSCIWVHVQYRLHRCTFSTN